AFIVAAAYYYERRAWRALGIVLGLSVWCRPDLLIVPIAIAVDYFLNRRSEKIDWTRLLVPVLVLWVAYGVFNLVLSGSVLPNTFAAKLAYYKIHRPGFWSAAWDFFTAEGQGLTMALVLVGLVAAFLALAKKSNRAVQVYPILI